MTVNVLYFAELKDITNKDNEDFELNVNRLKVLIDLLIEKYPNIQNIIWDQNTQELRNTISVIINNQPHHEKELLSKKLNDGDTIAFLLPVSGG